eukprot:jgi/Tetstr1/443599/TSEL_031598.t1
MSDGEEPVVEPTLSRCADVRALATAVAQLTARDRVVDGEGAHGSGSGQRFAGQPTGSGGAAERPDLLELAQSGRVGAKSVSAEDDYLAVPELLQRAESGYEAVRPDFTPYLARARNHAEAIDKAFRFRLAFLRRLMRSSVCTVTKVFWMCCEPAFSACFGASGFRDFGDLMRDYERRVFEATVASSAKATATSRVRLQLQVAGVGEDVAADVDVAAKDAFGSDELGQRDADSALQLPQRSDPQELRRQVVSVR